jgi:hypothetical protein
MGVFSLWMLIWCKVSQVKACFVHCNKARQKLLSMIKQTCQMHDSEPRIIVCEYYLKIFPHKIVFFSLLWKMCAIPREISGFRAKSISLTRRPNLGREFTGYTVSTVEDVLETPSCCLSSTSVLSLSKAVYHTHYSTVTLHNSVHLHHLVIWILTFSTTFTPKI